jgi:hypothetical protein
VHTFCSVVPSWFPYKILVKKPFRRSRHRWEDNIKMDLREVSLVGVGWSHLAQDRDWWWAHVNMVTNLRVP